MSTPAPDNEDHSDTADSEESAVAAVDEEGLRLHYDFVLIGTGLVQSILASALARAGKTVLHTDGSDYYGELDAVWTLPYLESQKSLGDDSWLLFQEHHHNRDETNGSSANGVMPISPRGSLQDLIVHSMGKTNNDTKNRKLQKGTEGTVPVWGRARVVGWKKNTDTEDNDESLTTEQPISEDYDHRLVLELLDSQLQDGNFPRLYTVDTSSFVTTQERVANDILEHRSRSLAIDVTPGLIWAQGPAVLGLLESSVSEYVEFKSLQQLWWYDASNKASVLQAVPCSKNDVFSSTLLSPMEKRRLMKFLQLALDYSVAESEKEHLGATATIESSEEASDAKALPAAWETLNERHLNQGRSLARPQNKSVSTSGLESLQNCIRDGVEFEEYLTEHHNLSPKLTALVRYALALDFGSEALGVGEGMQKLGQHLQSLGRFGTTAFLVPMYGSGELSQAFCRSAAVFGATYLLRRSAVGIQFTEDGNVDGILLNPYREEDETGESYQLEPPKLVRCSHVVVPEHAIATRENGDVKLRVLRRVSILTGKPTKDSVRHAVLLPPGSLPKSRHPYTIHGLWFDEQVHVTPIVMECGGCSILHMTTVVDAHVSEDIVLEEAVEAILEDTSVKEIFHIVFSYPLYESKSASENRQGLHVVQRSQPNLTVDEGFIQAQELFSRMCPDAGFLTLSKEIDTLVKERFGDRVEEDDEQMALSNAISLIQPDSQATEPLFIWLGDFEERSTPQRLLLPVPRPVEPTSASKDVESIIKRIEDHCNHPGHDPRVYFAACNSTNKDTLDFVDTIKAVISGVGNKQLQFQAFTNGTTRGSSYGSNVGLHGLQVSLFAAGASAYSKVTGRDEETFQSVCKFISEQASTGISVEVGLLEEFAEVGRPFARSLGVKEIHVFAE